MLISLSAKPIDVKKCAWYKFMGKRPAKFLDHNPKYDLELASGDVYGLTPATRGNYYLIEEFSLDTKFKLTEREAMNLLKRSKSHRGKVDGKSIKDSIRGAPAGMDKDNSLNPSRGAGATPVSVTMLNHPREDTDLTRKLKNVRINGMKKIEFIRAREMLPGEVYYFYDAVSTLRSYRRKHGLRVGQFGSWATELEREIEKQIPGIDVELGTVRMDGEVKHLIVVVDI